MRIAIDVRSLMEGRHSGVEEYATKIIKGLTKNAPQHEYIFIYNSARSVDLSFLSSMGEVVAFRFPNKIFNLCQYFFNWPKWDNLIAKRIGYKPDIIFAPNSRLLPVEKSATVVTVHDLSYELFPEFYSIKHRVWHKLIKPRELMLAVSHVIAVSQATKEDIVRLYGVPEDKVTVVYSGVSPQPKNTPEKKLPSPNKIMKLPDKFVLYLGAMEPRKNIISVIEAYSSIADNVPQDLVIAGESGWLMKGVEKTIKNSSAFKRIHCIGFVDEQDKAELYRRADLFVYPSFYEGFGFPPLEALLAGTPVITSHNSSLSEVVGNWATMIDPYNVSELALVMKEMIDDPPLVDEKIQEEILNKFSWDHAAQETLAVFDTVMRKRY
jgi:glycosyltransferase involved in cell wall biosynthesis